MKPKLARLGRLLVILALGTILFPAVTTPAGAEGQPQTLVSPIEKQVSIAEAAQSAPLMFVENAGQMDSQARYEVMGANSTLYLADDALWYNVVEESKAGSSLEKGQGPGIESQDSRAAEQPRRGVNLKVSFVGANPRPRLEPFNRLETDVSYFIGNDPAKWRPDVPVWGGVRYVDLYPGIDLELSGENGQLVQRMVAKSGANLDAVNLRIEGMDGLMLEGNHLLLSTQVGNLALPLLQTNSTSNDSTLAAPMGPTVQGGIVSHPFTSPSADAPAADETLVVSTLLGYSTFLGGGQDDSVNAIAVDGSGAAYVTGATNSTTGVSNFPKTPGTFPMGLHSEGFVVKFNPAGTALTYATFIGGSGWYDIGRAIAVDSTGHAFVAGQTDSNNFPTSVSAYDRTLGGSLDAFVTKLNPTGTAVDYSTYLGGAGQERAFGLAIDGQGAAYVAGETSSVGDFPVTVGAPQGSHAGSTYDGFIAKLNAAGSARVYATYLGSKEMDHIYGLAIDSSGSAYVTGETYTSASAPNFPVTGAAYDKIPNGGYEAFVTKLNAAGTAWAYSTYLGGTDYERGYAIAVDSTGAAYVAGETNSNFPTTAGAYRTTPVGGYDGFVTKLNSTGSALVYSTLLGGANWDTISALRLDTSGGAYVAGTTYSTNFPTTSTAYDRSFNLGSKDAFVAGIDPTGTALAYGSYLGGNAYDLGNAIAIDNAGGIYVAGATYSSNFPTSTTAYDKTFNAGATSDGFVTKLLLNKAVFLPVIIDNAYGGWNTGISIRNPLPTSITVRVLYYNAAGTVVLTENHTIPANGFWGSYSGGKFGGGWAGSATVFSTAEVPVLVNEVGPGSYSTGYSGDSVPGTTLYFPGVMDNGLGGWTTGIGIRNASSNPASVTFRYYNATGTLVKTESGITIPGNGYVGNYQGGKLGAGFVGSAVVTSNQPLVGIINQVHSAGKGVAHNDFIKGSATVNLPMMLYNAYGGWTTWVHILNTSSSASSGTIKYYNSAGTLVSTKPISLPGRGYTNMNTSAAGVPSGFTGSALISMNTLVVAVVNEIPTSGDPMGYEGVATGVKQVNLAAVMDNAYGGWTSRIGLRNTTSSSASVTIYYYNATGASLGSEVQTIAPNGYWGPSQGGKFPSTPGSAKIISSQPLAVIVNETGPGANNISYNGTR